MSYKDITAHIYEGTLVGKIIDVCGMQVPHTTLRLQVVAQLGLEIVGRPVDVDNIRKLEPKVTIRMNEYILLGIDNAV